MQLHAAGAAGVRAMRQRLWRVFLQRVQLLRRRSRQGSLPLRRVWHLPHWGVCPAIRSCVSLPHRLHCMPWALTAPADHRARLVVNAMFQRYTRRCIAMRTRRSCHPLRGMLTAHWDGPIHPPPRKEHGFALWSPRCVLIPFQPHTSHRVSRYLPPAAVSIARHIRSFARAPTHSPLRSPTHPIHSLARLPTRSLTACSPTRPPTHRATCRGAGATTSSTARIADAATPSASATTTSASPAPCATTALYASKIYSIALPRSPAACSASPRTHGVPCALSPSAPWLSAPGVSLLSGTRHSRRDPLCAACLV